MWTGLLNALFGCSHRRTTFPMTPIGKSGKCGNTYVACLDCGAELQYDWREMRVLKPVEVLAPASTQNDPVPLETDLQHSL